jgi:protoporphyrinogen oxidase
VGALRLGRVREWERLDRVPALEWLRRYTGPQAVEVVWGPLLAAKFGPAAGEVPAAWMWGRFQQRAGARASGRERLGYLRGGFRQVFEWLGAELVRLGADVRTGRSVQRIDVAGGGVAGVELDDGTFLAADDVVFAGPLPALAGLVPDGAADPRWTAVPGLGVLCVVLETRRPITGAYWTNVCDPALPFGGLIEHTNLVPASDYGAHVVYLSRYFLADEPIAAADPDAEAARWVQAMAARWPGFSAEDVSRVHAFRAPYAAPLVTVGHLARMAPLRSHIDGLVVATTAQIYPQDRGMSEGVRIGGEAAAAVLSRAPASRPRA